jgi:predicted small metal-binding protein
MVHRMSQLRDGMEIVAVSSAGTMKEEIMRLFECGTLVPGCSWHTRADNDAEVIRRAVDHMKTAHGETIIRENMVDHIRQRIRDQANAA